MRGFWDAAVVKRRPNVRSYFFYCMREREREREREPAAARVRVLLLGGLMHDWEGYYIMLYRKQFAQE